MTHVISTFSKQIGIAFGVLISVTIAQNGFTQTSTQSYVLDEFPRHETELTDEQKELLDYAAEEMESLIGSSSASKCLRIVGHAATWHKITDKSVYCERSRDRATAAGAYISALLQENSSRQVAYRSEDQAGLGNTGNCTGGTSLICKADPNADITIVWGGRADDEPIVDNRPSSYSQTAKDNRARNRRVEISFVEVYKKPEEAEEVCDPLSLSQTRNTVWAIIGKKPQAFRPAKRLHKWIKAGKNSPVCKQLAKAGLGTQCLFFERLAETYKSQFREDSIMAQASLMGAAYAILDGPDHRDRSKKPLGPKFRTSATAYPNKFRKGFKAGYSQMRIQLIALQASTERSDRVLTKTVSRMRCDSAKGQKSVRRVYNALRDEVMNNGEVWSTTSQRLAMAGRCRFTYPHASFSCAPMQ